MNIIYFNTIAEYQAFVAAGSIVKDGVTYQYNPSKDIYLVKTNNGTTVLNHALTIGSKSFNNSADVEITKADLGLGNVTNVNAETLVSALETAIRSLIPSQATSSNQLADKAFVNSSIATSTSNFLGTRLITALGLDEGESDTDEIASAIAETGQFTNVTVNDYCYIQNKDSNGNTVYQRFKAIEGGEHPEYAFEYNLNNSSFTAVQWNAINSGMTAALVSKIGTTESAVSGLQSSKLDKVNTANIVYGTDNGGAGKSYGVSNTATANSIAQRTSNGSIRTTVPATPDNSDAVNVGYLNTQLSGKLNKVTGTGGIRAYGIAADGTQMTLNVNASATGNTVVYRDSRGAVAVSDPVNSSDAASKNYVDTFVKQVII